MRLRHLLVIQPFPQQPNGYRSCSAPLPALRRLVRDSACRCIVRSQFAWLIGKVLYVHSVGPSLVCFQCLRQPAVRAYWELPGTEYLTLACAYYCLSGTIVSSLSKNKC